ncbi:MAG: holo-ACP synthase [Bacteroidia bacterium]|nr:holo-ACP synthase [Bacteroidia bacterium]
MILGTGIDMIEVERVKSLVDKGEITQQRFFHSGEITYCNSQKNYAESFAARFAAKEALFKALGTGWREGMAWHEIEIRLDELGKPHLFLHGETLKKAESMGVQKTHVSLSHIKETAIAMVVLEK